jgi:hypothetical protein
MLDRRKAETAVKCSCAQQDSTTQDCATGLPQAIPMLHRLHECPTRRQPRQRMMQQAVICFMYSFLTNQWMANCY